MARPKQIDEYLTDIQDEVKGINRVVSDIYNILSDCYDASGHQIRVKPA